MNHAVDGNDMTQNKPEKGKDERHGNLKIQNMAALLVERGPLMLAGQPDDKGAEDVGRRNAQQQGQCREMATKDPGAFACVHGKEVAGSCPDSKPASLRASVD